MSAYDPTENDYEEYLKATRYKMAEEPLIDSDLLEEIVCALVNHPESVRVEEITEGSKTTLRVYAHPEDNRHIIGRKGATVKILRQLFAVLAGKQGKWIFIEVTDDGPSPQRSKPAERSKHPNE